jgi:hypothetical protein
MNCMLYSTILKKSICTPVCTFVILEDVSYITLEAETELLKAWTQVQIQILTHINSGT